MNCPKCVYVMSERERSFYCPNCGTQIAKEDLVVEEQKPVGKPEESEEQETE